MLRRFLDWLRYVPIADPVQRSQAIFLQQLILVLFAAHLLNVAIGVAEPSLAPSTAGPLGSLLLALALLSALFLLRRGWLQAAVVVTTLVTLVAITRHIAAGGQIARGMIATAYVVPIALAGLMLPRPSLVIVTGLCVTALAGVTATGPGPARPEAGAVIAFAVSVAVIAVLLDRYRATWEQSLEAARANEARLILALDAGAMGTWDWDLRSGKIIWDDHHERIMGLPDGSFDGSYESFAQRVHPDDLPGLTAAIEQSRRTLAPYVHEYRILGPDGSVRWAAGRGRVYPGHDGQPTRMLGVLTDITARKKAELRLQAISAERDNLLKHLRLILEHTLMGVIISDPDFAITYWNPAAERIFGWRADEMLGELPDERIITPAIRARLPEIRQQIRTSVATTVAESPNLRKDGEVIICEWHNTPLFADDHSFIGFLSMVQDVTERQKREAEIRILNTELERRVVERTAELAAKNHELEVFAYSVSHDLKAPLRGIDGYSRLLEDEFAGRLDGDGPYYITMIRKAASGMGQLIDDLLAYSRVERRELKVSSITLDRLVALIVAEHAAQISQAGITVTVIVPKMVVLAEEEGLGQALRNLIENAIKFTRGVPGPTIVIGGEAGDSSCLLWVRDNGIGFAMTYHERIFELFQRLHRAEEYPGTGIGLAIVRKAVERMGGAVWAESTPGKGATFFLRLPCAHEAP